MKLKMGTVSENLIRKMSKDIGVLLNESDLEWHKKALYAINQMSVLPMLLSFSLRCGRTRIRISSWSALTRPLVKKSWLKERRARRSPDGIHHPVSGREFKDIFKGET